MRDRRRMARIFMPYLIPPSTVNIVEHLYDKVGFKTYLAMDINYDVGYRLKGSSPWRAAKSTVGVTTAVRASDQVQQRMAWALAQIVVVVQAWSRGHQSCGPLVEGTAVGT